MGLITSAVKVMFINYFLLLPHPHASHHNSHIYHSFHFNSLNLGYYMAKFRVHWMSHDDDKTHISFSLVSFLLNIILCNISKKGFFIP